MWSLVALVMLCIRSNHACSFHCTSCQYPRIPQISFVDNPPINLSPLRMSLKFVISSVAVPVGCTTYMACRAPISSPRMQPIIVSSIATSCVLAFIVFPTMPTIGACMPCPIGSRASRVFATGSFRWGKGNCCLYCNARNLCTKTWLSLFAIWIRIIVSICSRQICWRFRGPSPTIYC